MIRNFKFFYGDWQQPPLEPIEVIRPLLDNEMIIHYWNDGDYHNILTARVIAWANGNHAFGGGWIRTVYRGTMERFFYNRLSIPVIESIELLVDNITFTQDDEYDLSHRNFSEQLRIIYYEAV